MIPIKNYFLVSRKYTGLSFDTRWLHGWVIRTPFGTLYARVKNLAYRVKWAIQIMLEKAND